MEIQKEFEEIMILCKRYDSLLTQNVPSYEQVLLFNTDIFSKFLVIEIQSVKHKCPPFVRLLSLFVRLLSLPVRLLTLIVQLHTLTVRLHKLNVRLHTVYVQLHTLTVRLLTIYVRLLQLYV